MFRIKKEQIHIKTVFFLQIVETEAKSVRLLTHIPGSSLSCLGTSTSIKSSAVKIVLLSKISPLMKKFKIYIWHLLSIIYSILPPSVASTSYMFKFHYLHQNQYGHPLHPLTLKKKFNRKRTWGYLYFAL